MNLEAILRLIRLDKPVGTVLLWFPTAWALWVANHGQPQITLVLLFMAGTFLMRSAGCVVNDMADRHLDGHVARTRKRPLASGDIGLLGAFAILGVLLAAALGLLLQLPSACFPWALLALLLAGVYPFFKRFFSAPQGILGLAFSMGIPMAFVASGQPLTWFVGMLFLLNTLWVVAYDTLYAMADKEDDLRAGVFSTAISLGEADWVGAAMLFALAHALWLPLGFHAGRGWFFGACWLAGAGVMVWQLSMARSRVPAYCTRAFSASALYGMVMWIAWMQVGI